MFGAFCAAAQDRLQAAELLRVDASPVRVQDLVPVTGAVAFCRELKRLESDMGTLIEHFRATLGHRVEIDFQPALRPNANGTFRLYWGFPESFHTKEGTRTFTEYIPGRPTDAWMRTLGIRSHTRKEVGAFLKRLQPVEARYRELTDFLGRHRQRVKELLARIAKYTGTPHPAPSHAVGEGSSPPFRKAT